MNTHVTSGRISELLDLLGPAVLLPWPAGSKGDRRKWKHLQLSDMQNGLHLARLRKASNIGVALGEVSGGLVSIDLDQDSYVDALLAANPLLKDTLRTRGRRGCNIWVRCTGGYPRSQKLKDSNGAEIGEWRADGNQTIITGIHPAGMPYLFVVKSPVITVSYNAIIWPEPMLPPDATESMRVKRVRETEVVSMSSDCIELNSFLRDNDLINKTVPTGTHQNNTSLFKLARLVKSYDRTTGRPASPDELKFVFDRWFGLARAFLRRTRDEYWAEFLEAYYYARIGLDQDPIQVALTSARTKPLPDLTGFSDERVRLLAAICHETQLLVGDSPFFLPTRKLAELLGAHWSSVARRLVAVEALGLIHLAPDEHRKAGGHRSPRYHYGPRQTCRLPVANTVVLCRDFNSGGQ